MQQHIEITELLFKHLKQELTPDEAADLTAWVRESETNRQFFDEINNMPALMADVRAYKEGERLDLEAAWARIKELGWEVPVAQPKRIFRINKLVYAAAALLLIATATILYLLLHTDKSAAVPTVVYARQNDAKPSSTHAYLTLDDGSTIPLDNPSGLLARQGRTKVEKKDNGALSYSADGQAASDKLLYNKVTVPRGSDVVYLQLSDQTKVWLNAESSIRYPVTFNNDERRVEITGEAYFEVAKSHGKRFVVSKGGMSVTVLGTRFNVNTYENEADIKVTLLEGSVKVQREQLEKIIKPGQQAIVDGARINILNDVDMHQVVAWKEGKFVFNNTNIQSIMHQMERWYDLGPTQFESDAVKKWEFNGEISRYSSASKVLELLEKTGAVKFTVEGKKIVVRPL